MCEPIAIFEVLEPQRGAGPAPFSIERFGPEVKGAAVHISPMYVSLNGGNHVRVQWNDSSDFLFPFNDLVYSPAEGLARNLNDPTDVYPMRRFFDGKSERVWFGFRSPICREPDAYGGYSYCKPTKEELFLVADMSCQWWIGGSPPEK